MELFRIAAARGFLHPNHMLAGAHRRLTSSELVELLAFERLRPSGDRRQDIHFALLRYDNQQIASKGKSNSTPEDFLLYHKAPVMQASEIKGALRSRIKAAKGVRKKKREKKK